MIADIKPGATVRVTFDGEFHSSNDEGVYVLLDGSLTAVPLDAEIEVVAPPLPPEPPVGAYVEVRFSPQSAAKHVYRRVFIPAADSRDDGPGPEGRWQWLGAPSSDLRTWEQLHEDGAKVTRLYRTDEQPQEKYERASNGRGAEIWLHSCGAAAGWTATPGWCGCRQKDGEWTPLYVKADSDGD